METGEPAIALPDREIEIPRGALRGGSIAEPHPYLTVGPRGRIRSGPLVGLAGILLRKKTGFSRDAFGRSHPAVGRRER